MKETRGATNDLAGDFANVTSSFLREVFGSSRFSSSTSPTGRLEEAPVHDDIDEQIAAGGHDCTHLSPDALLFVTQALVRAILLDGSGRAARRRSWRAGGAAAA